MSSLQIKFTERDYRSCFSGRV